MNTNTSSKTSSIEDTTSGVNHLYAFPNMFPYNEMLFDEKLKLGDFGVKTRSYDPGFRGPVLLYTSGKVERSVAKSHGYNPREYVRPAIVGIGDLIEVKVLSQKELKSILFQFNNVKSIKEIYSRNNWVEPLPYGLFFQRLKRFNEPIAFTAEPGPVRMIKVPIDTIAEALENNGIKLSGKKLIYQ